jgi:hypothetical protein
MTSSLLALLASLALLAAAGCSPTGQQQAEQGTIQLPGERPAPNGLNIPPDAWAGPARPAATSLVAPRESGG